MILYILLACDCLAIGYFVFFVLKAKKNIDKRYAANEARYQKLIKQLKSNSAFQKFLAEENKKSEIDEDLYFEDLKKDYLEEIKESSNEK